MIGTFHNGTTRSLFGALKIEIVRCCFVLFHIGFLLFRMFWPENGMHGHGHGVSRWDKFILYKKKRKKLEPNFLEWWWRFSGEPNQHGGRGMRGDEMNLPATIDKQPFWWASLVISNCLLSVHEPISKQAIVIVDLVHKRKRHNSKWTMLWRPLTSVPLALACSMFVLFGSENNGINICGRNTKAIQCNYFIRRQMDERNEKNTHSHLAIAEILDSASAIEKKSINYKFVSVRFSYRIAADKK